jgi:pimeloyl-ACP methyl ester carboxylesterase
MKKLISVILFLFMSQALAAETERNISFSEAGHGQTLILIHAFPTDLHLWKAQQHALKKYFHVVSLDLWGFGHSRETDGHAVTMSDYADEVQQLLDELQVKKAIVGGESMGGYVALAFLQKYPERVNGLILSDTQSIADTAEAKAKREAAAQDVLAHGSQQLIAGFMLKALTSDAPKNTVTFLENILAAQKPTAIASALRGMAEREDTSNLLANSHLPILILTGEEDALISPEQSRDMHALAKNSKLVVIAHAGHLSSLEQPEVWNRAVVGMFYQ